MPRMEGREAFLGGSIFGKQARFQKRPRVPTFYAPAEECKALVT